MTKHDPSNAVETVKTACRLIESAEIPRNLTSLATELGWSVSHFHRVFKQITGVTAKAYADEHRTQKVRKALIEGASVTEAMYAAGYQSSGRFYENIAARLGMTPREFRGGGQANKIFFAIGECDFGSILVASTVKGICSIALDSDPVKLLRELQDMFRSAELIGADKEYEAHIATVIGFIAKPEKSFPLPLDIHGTAFQQQVWQALREIPLGTTVSYADIANKIDRPKSVRAVAGACAANKIAIAIPCHRVVRQDGNLSGYRWGIARKQALIDREQGQAE